LQDADAADLTQDVLRSVAKAAKALDYDPARGSFRSWLFTVARNKLIDFRQRQLRGQAIGGTTAQELLDQQPVPADEEMWEAEFRRHVFALAVEQVRPDFETSTWDAFWQTAVEGRKPQDVAAALGISVGAVYIAKSRVQARLKERVRELSTEEIT